MNYQSFTLTNGLKLVHKPDNTAVSYCGIVINAGSRDEAENEQGMAHFIEHMLFKGTDKYGTLDWAKEKVGCSQLSCSS